MIAVPLLIPLNEENKKDTLIRSLFWGFLAVRHVIINFCLFLYIFVGSINDRSISLLWIYPATAGFIKIFCLLPLFGGKQFDSYLTVIRERKDIDGLLWDKSYKDAVELILYIEPNIENAAKIIYGRDQVNKIYIYFK